MRRTASDEDVEVELVGDDGGRTVELGGTGGGRDRRRRPELALLALAIAVVVALVVIDDGGGDGSVATPSTTTTTERRTTSTRRTTTTRVPRSTTTTSWPQVIAGTGPLLPAPTATLVAMVEFDGTIAILDLDTGGVCRTQIDRDGGWMPWTNALRSDALVQTNSGAVLVVDGTCQVHRPGIAGPERWIAAAGSTTVWLGSGDIDQRFVEHRIEDGEPTGREVTTPGSAMTSIVVVDERAVVGVSGELTVLEPDGTARSIGTGTPLSGAAGVLLAMTCPALECAMVAIDLDSGARTSIDARPTGWEQPALSPDGRWARVVVQRSGLGRAALVDLRRGTVREISGRFERSVFTADGRWLLAMEADVLVAAPVDDPSSAIEVDVDLRPSDTFVALQR